MEGRPDEYHEYSQVLVCGGGLSGCAAAIAAARIRVKVVLIEPTHMLGGQAGPAGVSAFDVPQYYDNLLLQGGIWAEFITRLQAFYREVLDKPNNTSQYRDTSHSGNPCVVDAVLADLLDEEGVQVYRNVDVLNIEHGSGAVRVDTSAGEITALNVVDATETGEVLVESGQRYRLGASVLTGRPEPGWGTGQFIQSITCAAVVQRYDEGLPKRLVIEKPPENYLDYRRFFAHGYPQGPGRMRIGDRNGFAGYRGMPDLSSDVKYSGSEWEKISRTSLNFLNDVETPAAFILDGQERERVLENAMNATLSILFFLQQEFGLPWGVATDEGFGNGVEGRHAFANLGEYPHSSRHFPPIAYIRESARLVGRTTLTGKRIFRHINRASAPWDNGVVAIGTYHPDLHGGRRPTDFETDLHETVADKPTRWREGPFAIPFESLVPRGNERVIPAEKNISASRIAASALRLHPTVVGIGQAAGVLAALAAQRRCVPGKVSPISVQIALLRQGAPLVNTLIRDLPEDSDDRVAALLACARGAVELDRDTTPTRLATGTTVSGSAQISTLPAVRAGRAIIESANNTSNAN